MSVYTSVSTESHVRLCEKCSAAALIVGLLCVEDYGSAYMLALCTSVKITSAFWFAFSVFFTDRVSRLSVHLVLVDVASCCPPALLVPQGH